jgi:hypothetical protein
VDVLRKRRNVDRLVAKSANEIATRSTTNKEQEFIRSSSTHAHDSEIDGEISQIYSQAIHQSQQRQPLQRIGNIENHTQSICVGGVTIVLSDTSR